MTAWKRFCHHSYNNSGGHGITIKLDNISLTVSTRRRLFCFYMIYRWRHISSTYIGPIPHMLSRPNQCERQWTATPHDFFPTISHGHAQLAMRWSGNVIDRSVFVRLRFRSLHPFARYICVEQRNLDR